MRSNHDPEVTGLRILLKKFCKLNHLPTTVSDELEYNCLRNGITGGLSKVMHRWNILNNPHQETPLRSRNQQSHPKGHTKCSDTLVYCDGFNSPYPPSFSSEVRPFNKYQGGTMHIPSWMINSLNCNDANGNVDRDIKPKWMNCVWSWWCSWMKVTITSLLNKRKL